MPKSLAAHVHAYWLQALADVLSAPLQEGVSPLCLCIGNALEQACWLPCMAETSTSPLQGVG